MKFFYPQCSAIHKPVPHLLSATSNGEGRLHCSEHLWEITSGLDLKIDVTSGVSEIPHVTIIR
jgi:hypothetical protein